MEQIDKFKTTARESEYDNSISLFSHLLSINIESFKYNGPALYGLVSISISSLMTVNLFFSNYLFSAIEKKIS